MASNATYKHEDVMQALCAALIFGSDVGHDALCSKQDEVSGRARPLDPVPLIPDKESFVKVSPMARDLLALAQSQAATRGVAFVSTTGVRRYDLRESA